MFTKSLTFAFDLFPFPTFQKPELEEYGTCQEDTLYHMTLNALANYDLAIHVGLLKTIGKNS